MIFILPVDKIDMDFNFFFNLLGRAVAENKVILEGGLESRDARQTA